MLAFKSGCRLLCTLLLQGRTVYLHVDIMHVGDGKVLIDLIDLGNDLQPTLENTQATSV